MCNPGVVAMRFLLVVLMLVASPLWADEVTEKSSADARAMIYAHDIDGFSRAIIAAHAADLAAKGDQNLQRTLFTPFGVTDPRVAAFTADWLAREPDSPYALTARVWYLRAMGWAMRGTALPRFTWPAAMDQMAEMHGAGMEMALRARELAPDLVAASDAVIRMGQTFGMADLAAEELARIMDIAPNYGSLLRAANSLSPKWGGSVDAVARACEDYATLLPDVEGYTVDICLVEMFIAAPVDGAARDWAWDMLTRLPDHPNLIAARTEKAVENRGSPPERLAALEAFFANGGTWTTAAMHLDIERSASGEPFEKAFPAAVERAFAQATEDLLYDPGDPELVRTYFDLIDSLPIGKRPDQAMQLSVLRNLLAVAPYNPTAWMQMATLQSAGLPVAETSVLAPAVANAVSYSNHQTTVLAEMTGLYAMAYANGTADARLAAIRSETYTFPAAFDTDVSCPYTRLVRLLEEACRIQDIPAGECRNAGAALPEMLDSVNEIAARGACVAERTAPIEALVFEPMDAP